MDPRKGAKTRSKTISSENLNPRKTYSSKRYRKTAIAGLMLGSTAIILVVSVLIYFGLEMWTQATVGPRVESRFGGLVLAPYVQVNGKPREVMVITDIVSGSAFDQAGLVNEEIVVSHPTIGGLYKELDQPAGTAITIEVVTGGDGPSLDKRQRRQVTIIAP